MKLICADNIFSDEINKYIYELIQSENKYLYLTNSLVANSERKKSNLLSPIFNQSKNIYYFENFLKCCAIEIYNSSNYISNVDIVYILNKIIDNYFSDDSKKKIFKDIDYGLFKLYKLLIDNNCANISDKTLSKIKEKNSISEFYIFDIYNKFINTLNSVVSNILKGNKKAKEIDDFCILIPESVNPNFDIFIRSYRNKINEKIQLIDTLILDGFFYFTDELNYIVKHAINLNKNVILVTKNLKDKSSKFLINEFIKKLGVNKKDIEYREFKNECNNSYAINYLKNNFYNEQSSKLRKCPCDSSINIIKPFLSRYEELKFVSQQISNILKHYENCNIEKIKEVIENDIAVITAVDHNQICSELDNIFKRYGIFIYCKPKKPILDKEVNDSNLKNIFYSLDEFLSSNILYCDGTELNVDEKILFFSQAYRRIKISGQENLSFSSPVLEYVFQLYDIAQEGISIQRFKLLLFSNWYYHTGNSKTKWDKYVGTFEQVETFFDNDIFIDSWILKFKNILNIQLEIADNSLYKFHPFLSVNKEDIEMLISILEDLNKIIKSLSKTRGTVRCHLDYLKKNIINSKIIDLEFYSDLTPEQKSIKEFYEFLKKIVSDSIIGDVETQYFSRYLKILFSSINESCEEESTNMFNLRICSMINLKKYKYTFFIVKNIIIQEKILKNFPLLNPLLIYLVIKIMNCRLEIYLRKI